MLDTKFSDVPIGVCFIDYFNDLIFQKINESDSKLVGIYNFHTRYHPELLELTKKDVIYFTENYLVTIIDTVTI